MTGEGLYILCLNLHRYNPAHPGEGLSFLLFLECTDLGLVTSYSHFHSASLPMQRCQALSTINNNFLYSRTGSVDTRHSRGQSLDIDDGKVRKDAMNSCLSSLEVGHTVSRSSININFELEKLRIELRHTRGMYAMAQNEALDASRKDVYVYLRSENVFIAINLNGFGVVLFDNQSRSTDKEEEVAVK
ncbi:hypothetical protein Q3G72_023017 [Acer saccharum]|nr:hypothetical protein Q3G72_023017 [Acer saccharum]